MTGGPHGADPSPRHEGPGPAPGGFTHDPFEVPPAPAGTGTPPSAVRAERPVVVPRRVLGGAAAAAIVLVTVVIGAVMFLLLETNTATPKAAHTVRPRVSPSASAPIAAAITPSVSTPAPTSATHTESSQAQAINTLLDRSAAERSTAGVAVSTVGQCPSTAAIAAAARDLSAAAATRMRLVRSLSSLPIDRLPQGKAMVGYLAAAWLASAASDRNYSSWASNVLATASASGTCSPGAAAHGTSFRQAQVTDQRATAAKRSFIAAWNPLAAQLGLPARSGTGL